MNPTIPLIMMACCALTTACSTTPGGAKLGDGFTGPDLQYFVLPRVQVENVSLQTALQRVNETIQSTAQLCGERAETLVFQYKGQPENKISADWRQVPADTAIHFLALQAGMNTTFKGNTIELTPFPADPSIATREFKVPPTFRTDAESLMGATPNSLAVGGANSSSLTRFLRRHNILKSSRAQASYEPSSSTLRATSTRTDISRLEAWIDSLLLGSPRMIKLEATRLTFDRDSGRQDSVMSLTQAERWTRSADRARSAEVLSLPSLTARPGQSGTIEIIREWIDQDGGQTFFGTRLGFEGELFGNGTTVKIAYERNLLEHGGKELPISSEYTAFPRLDGGSLTSARKEELDSAMSLYVARKQRPAIRTRAAWGSYIIPEDKVLVLRTAGTSREFEYLLVRAFRIDATGRPVRSSR